MAEKKEIDNKIGIENARVFVRVFVCQDGEKER